MSMSDWTQRDVTASGVRLRVVEVGDGPAVLFLHGMFVDHRTWHAVMDALSDGLRLVAPDLPGFGESEKPAASRFSYELDAFADAVAGLYAGLGLGRAAVVGHALGGAVALTLAARHPELVSRLVLVDALCYEQQFDFRSRTALLPLVGSFVLKQLWGRTIFRAFFRSRLLGPGATLPNGRIDDYYGTFNTPAARGSALAAWRATVDTRAVVAKTLRIQSPTLVVWGRHDRLYPAGYGQRLAHEIRDAGFELLDAGHSPQEECPSTLAATMGPFLRAERPSLF
jgi:pimeloyl-ACP methyl ester carboxylesterase